jgi:biopolymer transport protein ExbB
MSVRLLLLIVLASAGVHAAAADAATANLRAATAAARNDAEQRLERARVRIADEHAALLKELQAALAGANAARERLAAAEREAKAVGDDLARRTREQERELVLIRQLADRALVAARLGPAADRELAAKPPLARVDAALAGLEGRVAALPNRLALRFGAEPVVTRGGRLATVPVLRLGEARAIALGAEHGSRGLLERAADGSSWLVAGPALPPVALAGGRPALIPLDAVGSAAHQPDAVQRTLAQWLAAGRFFIWPIIAVLAIGLLIAGERALALARRRVDPRRLVEIAGHLARGDLGAANAAVAGRASPLDRVLATGLAALSRPREAREAAVEQALLAETGQLTRGLPAIAVLAGVAPLLGLLGTVTGMIDMFAVIAAQGSGNAKSLSGGISEALICTQAGMLVAIPLLLLHAWLARLADRRAQLLEEAACGVLGLTEHGDQPAPAKAPAEALA